MSAKSMPRPSRITVNTIERSWRWPTEIISHPKLHVMPTSRESAASSGTINPRNATIISRVISPIASRDAIVESRIASVVSSASMTGIPVRPHSMSGTELSATTSLISCRIHDSVAAMRLMPVSPSAM